MRARLLFMTCILPAAFISCALTAAPLKDPPTKYFTLDNGLRVYLMEKHSVPLVHFAFGFNCGSKDETQETSGLVHLLEHMLLFGGSEDRSGDEVGRDIRSHGGYFNGHTDRDLSLFVMTVPADAVDFALNDQKTRLFELPINQAALDKEKEVILEELMQIKDDPLRYASARVYQNLFKGHVYEKPIYGRAEVIQNTDTAQLAEFHHRFFVPANCALGIVGDFMIPEMEKKVREYLGTLESRELSLPEHGPAAPLKSTVEETESMDVTRAYMVIGITAPDYNHADQYAADLLTEVLGRGINPMLNHPLLERRIHVSNLSMSYGAHRFGGAFLIRLTMEPKNISAARREILKYLKTSQNLKFSVKDHFGDAQLRAMDFMESARSRILFRSHRSQEYGALMAESIARHLLLTDESERPDYIERIQALTSSGLRKTAARYLSKPHISIVSIVPNKED